MTERITASEDVARLVAELRRLRDAWAASSDTLLRFGVSRLDVPIDALTELEELLRRGIRVLGGG
jgi:hypothetical protein